MTMVRGFEPGPQPGGRAPAPGELGLVQAFVNTFWRPGDGTDMLARPADLRAWLWECGLPGAEGPVSAAQLAQALDLREGLRGLLYVNNGATADPARQARLDAALRRAERRHPADGVGPGARARGRRGGRRAGEPRDRRRARDARRPLLTPEGVSRPALRVGVLRPLAQRRRPLVLDEHLRQPGEGARLLPPPPALTGRAGLTPQRGAQRLVEIQVAEVVAELARAPGDRPPPLDHEIGHLAVEGAHGERRHGGDRGTVQSAPERPRELAVRDRLGGGGVDRARPGVVGQGLHVDPDDVVDVHPRHVSAGRRLPARPRRA